jgi:hypothetical protein
MSDQKMNDLFKSEPKYIDLNNPDDWRDQTATDLADLTSEQTEAINQAFPPLD